MSIDGLRKIICFVCLLLLIGLVACSNRNPLISDQLEVMTIECMNSEELQEITNEKTLKNVLKEVNTSRREGTEEMEFPEGQDVALETVSGETYDMVLFNGGKSLVEGFYIHSDIPNFCVE